MDNVWATLLKPAINHRSTLSHNKTITRILPRKKENEQKAITSIAIFEISGFTLGTVILFRVAAITIDGISERYLLVSKTII